MPRYYITTPRPTFTIGEASMTLRRLEAYLQGIAGRFSVDVEI